MFIDLTHNKIISETISRAFIKSVEERLCPMLEARYGGNLLGIQMYEDYIADGFLFEGEWYYPLTLVFAESPRTLWIKWQISRHGFTGGNPYAYTGEEPIAFSEAVSVPTEFKNALSGRSVYCEEGLLPIRIDSPTPSPTVLSGKYSQTFIDEMSRQLTAEIRRSQAVESLAGSTIEIRLVFSPETYMEHTSENVTYRRLLLTDKGCSPRDFWVRWTRLDSAVAYSVSDTPAPDSIRFEIGEDVPQKVREREYRYLVRVDADKYHGAMARKNVTEWREILKRAIRRGDIVKIENDTALSEERDEELRRELSAILGVAAEPAAKEAPVSEAPEAESELIRLAREALMADTADVEQPVTVPDTEDTFDLDTVSVSFDDEDEDEPLCEPADEEDTDEDIYLSADDEDEDSLADVALIDGADVIPEADEPEAEPTVAVSLTDVIDDEIERVDEEEKTAEAEESVLSEERIRAEIEAKLRLEYESRARLAAEEEAARLRREQELLRAENERLMEKARREAEAKTAEEARLKAEIEAKLRQEAREKERLAEAAILAMEEKRRLEAEREKAERARAAEERRLAEEQRLAEEKARLEAERAAEAERIRREAEKAAEVAKALEAQGAPKYISRTAEFTFRRIVDPNVTKRIYEIVKATIEFYHKEDVYIRIKASVPDSSTVKLEFLEVPEEEGELVVNIIKALGKSDLGIAKATLD